MLIALASTREGSIPPISSIHRLWRGLPGYLIRFAPHAFAPQRQHRPRAPLSPTGVPPDIYAFHHYTRNSVLLYRPQAGWYRQTSPKLSLELSPPTDPAAYTPFTPSKFGQRSPPTYYRGCWHVVSRGFFLGYRLVSSPRKGVYNPQAFFPHAVSLRQAFAHCARFPAAASRRSGGRVAVPLWPVVLSHRLPVVGLVGRYLTNYLMGRQAPPHGARRLCFPVIRPETTCGISSDFSGLSPTCG